MKSKLALRCVAFNRRLVTLLTILTIYICVSVPHSLAHQQPATVILLDIRRDRVEMELQLPLDELELAFGHDAAQKPEALIAQSGAELKDYLIAHIKPMSAENQSWSVQAADLEIQEAEQTQSGHYQEIKARLVLTPPDGASTKNFLLNYDVIMHQVVTHYALVSVRSDAEMALAKDAPVDAGIIAVDTETTRIPPLRINLEKNQRQTDFFAMIDLGMRHIKEGTDHLLFLLVLLLPAALLAENGKWTDFGGTNYSFRRLLKIVTAFTAGHSITLLIGAFGWLHLPQQPVEVLIAVSILISAAHAIRPIFPGKEMHIAAGFGLVHGLAFATALSDLHLNASALAFSIFGFNVGIELMQIFIIALVAPWLILLNQTTFERPVRIGGAALAALASVAWIAERISGEGNAITDFIENQSGNAHLAVLILASIALFAFALRFVKNKKYSIATQQ